MSETPRTDKCDIDGLVVAVLARNLERELAAMTAERDAAHTRGEECGREVHRLATANKSLDQDRGELLEEIDRANECIDKLGRELVYAKARIAELERLLSRARADDVLTPNRESSDNLPYYDSPRCEGNGAAWSDDRGK